MPTINIGSCTTAVIFNITYQGHDLDQSEEAWETFPTVGLQQRNKLTNQRAPNETNGPAITKNSKKKTHSTKPSYKNSR